MTKMTAEFLIKEQLLELDNEKAKLEAWLESEKRVYRDDATQITEKRVALEYTERTIRRFETLKAELERINVV